MYFSIQIRSPVLLTYHALDGILKVGCQSHEGSIKNADSDTVRLTQAFGRVQATVSPYYHQYFLMEDPQWPTILAKLKRLF